MAAEVNMSKAQHERESNLRGLIYQHFNVDGKQLKYIIKGKTMEPILAPYELRSRN